MASLADVRRLALALPETSETTSYGNVAWAVRGKAFVWERPLREADRAALGAATPTGTIIGVRTGDLEMKDVLLGSDPDVYFTTPHFDGYAAVLVRLGAVPVKRLREILVEAWLTRAPKTLANAFLAKAPAARRPSPAKPVRRRRTTS